MADKYGLKVDSKFNITSSYPKVPLKTLINDSNKHLVDADALDLIERMLKYDHDERITSTDALNHPYFDSVRGT